jgi:hypothetical protein
MEPYTPLDGKTNVSGSKWHAAALSITPSTRPSRESQAARMALVKRFWSASVKLCRYCGTPFTIGETSMIRSKPQVSESEMSGGR